MNQFLKNLPGYQVKATSLLIFTENSMGCPGVVRASVKGGRVSEFLPVSSDYLKRRVDILSGNEIVKQEKTLRILTPDVLYYNEYGQHAGIVMVRQPCEAWISVQKNESIHKVQYSFPYLVLMYDSSSHLHLYFAYEPPGPNTDLYDPMLPNFFGAAQACLGSVKVPPVSGTSLDKLKDALWKAIFKATYTGHSGMDVYKEMTTQRSLSKYARLNPGMKTGGKMRKLVKQNITHGIIDLYKEW